MTTRGGPRTEAQIKWLRKGGVLRSGGYTRTWATGREDWIGQSEPLMWRDLINRGDYDLGYPEIDTD